MLFLSFHALIIAGILVSFWALFRRKELPLLANLAAIVALVPTIVIQNAPGLILSDGHGWLIMGAAVFEMLLYTYSLIVASNQRRDTREEYVLDEQVASMPDERLRNPTPLPGGPLNGHKYIDH